MTVNAMVIAATARHTTAIDTVVGIMGKAMYVAANLVVIEAKAVCNKLRERK